MAFNDYKQPADAAEAIRIQNELRHEVRLENGFRDLDVIAGVDVSYDLRAGTSRAVIVTMAPGDLRPRETVVVDLPTSFPYVPGLLSFREIPVILAALGRLRRLPDLFMVDGQGVAHPRRLGIAAHLGVLTGVPSIGVAKSRLTGRYEEPGPRKGDRSLLADKGERIGTVLRSKERTLPLFVSPGHLVDQETAVEITLRCLTRYRLPEPTRIADKVSKDRADRGAAPV